MIEFVTQSLVEDVAPEVVATSVVEVAVDEVAVAVDVVLALVVVAVVLVAADDVEEVAPIGAVLDSELEVEVFWLVPPAGVVGVVPVFEPLLLDGAGTTEPFCT